MAELRLSDGEETMVLYPEGTIEDIRINACTDGIDKTEYTAFVAYQMSGQDAVVIRLSEKIMDSLSVSYFSGEAIISLSLAE